MSRRLTQLAFALGAVTVLVLAASTAQAIGTTRFVNNGVACDDATSNSSVTPYCHVQPAIAAAASGDTIQIAAGTYADDGSAAAFVIDILTKDLTIVGGGQDVTFIDGENARAGIRVHDGDLALSHLTVRNGAATGSGGGVTAQWGANLDLTDVSVIDSSANANAAGILGFNAASIDLLRVTVTNNTVGGSGTYGGGLAVNAGTVTVTDSVFEANTAQTQGGAIHLSGTDTTTSISGTTFIENTAVTDDGGAINQNSTGTLSIEDSTFDGNEALSGVGGAIAGGTGTVTIGSSTFVDNAANNGGAIQLYGGVTTAIGSSTFTGNSAVVSGGAIRSIGSTTTVSDSTISANQAAQGGGYTGDTGVVFTNSILADNISTGNGPECDVGFTSGGYNLIENTTDCTVSGDTTGNITGQDPQLRPLADNGGPTMTMALGSASPARNAGNPTTPGSGGGACLEFDQRGFTRVPDNDCDMGAYELYECAGRAATIVGTNGQDTLAGTDGPDVIVGLAGNDSIDGGGSRDIICAGNGLDTVHGGSGADLIYGDAGADALYGESGRDTIRGGSGDDEIRGGNGNDRLHGNNGNDYVHGGAGNDLCATGETYVKCEA